MSDCSRPGPPIFFNGFHFTDVIHDLTTIYGIIKCFNGSLPIDKLKNWLNSFPLNPKSERP